MKTFAVVFGVPEEGVLELHFYEAESWREAALKHPESCWDSLEPSPEAEGEEAEICYPVPHDLEDAKQEALDQDTLFTVEEVPEKNPIEPGSTSQ
jgi:hypothetical protein